MTLLRNKNPKNRMERARELIKAKRYDEARELLEGIDHPKAREWLNKLDTIVPSKAENLPLKKPQNTVPLWFPLVILVGLVVMYLLTSNTQTLPPLPTPTNIPITRCAGPEYLICYRDQLRTALSQHGANVTGIDEEFYPGGRIDAWVDVELTRSNNYTTALNVMDQALRVYAGSMPPERAGSFMITVGWTRDGRNCFDNAGMGYLTMQGINWDNVTQAGIFDAIDRNLYGDEDAPYGQIGVAPDLSQFPECNR